MVRTMWRGMAVWILLGWSVVAGTSQASDIGSSGAQWRLASENGGIRLYSRVRAGSALKEFKAIGLIDAPTRAVHNVLNDVEGYAKFMPFTAECRVLKREGNSIYVYQRISPRIVGDRDYTLHVEENSWLGDGGLVYSKRWDPASEIGRAED